MEPAQTTVYQQVPVLNHRITGHRIAAAFLDFIPLTILFFVMAAVFGEPETVTGKFEASLLLGNICGAALIIHGFRPKRRRRPNSA